MTAITDLTKHLPPELRRLASFERVLGVVLLATPLVLILVDTEPIRESISAYHDVGAPAAFYVPLTVGAMLFLVNGIVRGEHVYNVVLGLALAGVILFDHDDGSAAAHTGFALLFFGGNLFVMAFCSTHKSKLLKVLLVGTIAVAGVLWRTDVISTFWAEWVSLLIVATHFILDSASWTQYRALRPSETPDLVPEGSPAEPRSASGTA